MTLPKYALVYHQTNQLLLFLHSGLPPLLNIYPEAVLTNYEKGLRNDFLNVGPGTTIRGVLFSFQAGPVETLCPVRSRSEYHVPGSAARTAYKMVGALPFVPIEDDDLA